MGKHKQLSSPHNGYSDFPCDFGQYDVAYNGVEYNIVKDMLNAKFDEKRGWICFITSKLWVGRYVANDDGAYRPACDNPQQRCHCFGVGGLS